MSLAADRKLDCVGLFCPMPILKTRDAMKGMAVGETLEMLSDDPASEADMKSWTARTGQELLEIKRNGAVFRFIVRKTR
jgi:tRNA 2-thiouridine synthesizing protein A